MSPAVYFSTTVAVTREIVSVTNEGILLSSIIRERLSVRYCLCGRYPLLLRDNETTLVCVSVNVKPMIATKRLVRTRFCTQIFERKLLVVFDSRQNRINIF